MLVATDLTKSYGMRPVLRRVSLSIDKGEFVAILGANGAGKTTLLRVLATLIRPDSGQLSVGDVDALQHPAQARARIGLVSHQPLLYPDLTAQENLLFYARMYGITDALAQVSAVLRRVELHPRAHDPVRTFSRGMVQRLAIARAVLHNPPVLLLDEPYTGLDQSSARNLSALLREFAISGRSVVMTTHEFGRGLEGVQRALVIRGGRMADELRENITGETVARLLG
jgi:heme exporter protein A